MDNLGSVQPKASVQLARQWSGKIFLLSDSERYRAVTPAALPLSEIVDVSRSVGVSADHVIPMSWKDAHARDPFSYAVAVGNEALPEVPGIGGRYFFGCQFPFPMKQDTNVNMGLVYLSQYEGIVVYSEYIEHHLRARLGELLACNPHIAERQFGDDAVPAILRPFERIEEPIAQCLWQLALVPRRGRCR